jgi:hypothetical protein
VHVVDIPYITAALREGSLGLALVLIPLPFLLVSGSKSHMSRLLASAPGLIAAVLFVVACLASSWTSRGNFEPHWSIYQAILGLSLALIIPAIFSLNRRAVGFLHLSTLTGLAYLWFVGGMTLSHDWI